MMVDNPAERLHQMLKRGKDVPAHRNAREVWRELLQTEDEPLLLIRLGVLAQLPAQIILILRDDLDDNGDWGHWYTQVSRAFVRQNFHSDWSSFISHIDDHSMSGLSMSARLIRMKVGVATVNFDKIAEIRERLMGVYSEILADESLEKELRRYLARAIMNVIQAVDAYAIAGIDGITEAIDSLVGRLAMDEPLQTAASRPSSVRTAFGYVKDLVTTLSVVEKFPALAHGISEVAQRLPHF